MADQGRAGMNVSEKAPVCPRCARRFQLPPTMRAEYGAWSGELLYRCPDDICRAVIYEKDRR